MQGLPGNRIRSPFSRCQSRDEEHRRAQRELREVEINPLMCDRQMWAREEKETKTKRRMKFIHNVEMGGCLLNAMATTDATAQQDAWMTARL